MSDYHKLQFVLDIATMTDGMRPKVRPHVQTFTGDTAKFLAHISKSAVDLTWHLLSNDIDQVMLDWSSTNLLKKAFRKVHQNSGETYFKMCKGCLNILPFSMLNSFSTWP